MRDEKKDSNHIEKIVFWISIVVFFIGLALTQGDKTEYSTSEYWVAKDYHHVYEKYSGEIVDYIEDDETCKISGDIITVTKRAKTYTLGCVISVISSFVFGGILMGWIDDKWGIFS